MESMEEELRFAEEQAAETDRILEQMTLEEVRKRMEEQAKMQAGDSEEEQAKMQTGDDEEENVADSAEDHIRKAIDIEKREAGKENQTVSTVGEITAEVEPVELVEPVYIK